MKLTTSLFFLFIQVFCFGQNIEVSIRNVYVESIENNKIISSIQCEINSITIDSTKKVKLLFAEGKDKHGKKYKMDDFDYFDYDDMVLKNTFPITFITTKRIESSLKIHGQVRYFTPSIENEGIKIIENPKQNCDVNILKDHYNIKAIILNVDNLIAVKENEKEFDNLITEIVSINKLNKKHFKKSINLLLSDHKAYSWNSKQYFALYFEDPDDKLSGVHTSINNKIVHDGGGTYRFGLSKLITRRFLQNIEPNWKLILDIETPNSIKDYSFNLNDVSFKDKKE